MMSQTMIKIRLPLVLFGGLSRQTDDLSDLALLLRDNTGK